MLKNLTRVGLSAIQSTFSTETGLMVLGMLEDKLCMDKAYTIGATVKSLKAVL